MKRKFGLGVRAGLVLSLGLTLYGCGGDDDNGEAVSTGGSSAAGARSTGGTRAASGGIAATSGGASAGGPRTGGTAGTGGGSTGGSPATGGSAATGGSLGQGGTAGGAGGEPAAGTSGTAGNAGQGGEAGEAGAAGALNLGGVAGISTGGISTAGTDTGGVAGGGADTGGAESGGAESGGAETAGAGGEETGGVSTAGAGGADTGGAESGGAESGGAESGGAETAGAGGEETGGAETAGGGAENAGAGGEGGAETAGAGGEATGGEGGAGGAGGAASFCSLGNYAFCDDFEDGDSAGWVALGTSSSNLGVWTVATDTGFDGSATLSFQEDAATAGGNYHYQLASGAGVGPWVDQTVTAYIKLTTPVSGDNNKVGICARMSGTSNNTLVGYCLFLRAGQLQLSRKALNEQPDAGGGVTTFNTISGTSNPTGGTIPSFTQGNWYKVALQVANVVLGDGGTGVLLTGYVDDVALITVIDGGAFNDAGATALPVTNPGFAAVVTRSNDSVPTPTAASFDNVTVTSP